MIAGGEIDFHIQCYQLPKNLVEMTRGCLYADDIENGYAKSCKKSLYKNRNDWLQAALANGTVLQ